MPGVKNVIAVGAGKGGVGKSTVSVNLAVGLARKATPWGFSMPTSTAPPCPLLGLHDLDVRLHENMLQVMYVHGVKAMTIGKLVDPEKPLIWARSDGPRSVQAFRRTDGVGVRLPHRGPAARHRRCALTMSQMLSVSGAVVVCTPQKVAQDDAVRGPDVPATQDRGAGHR